MDRKLIDYLPPVLQKVREMKIVLNDGEQRELSDMWDACLLVMDNQFVETSSIHGVLRWEKILNIQAKAGESLDERKFKILARINETLPYTFRRLKEMLDTLCGKGGCSIEINNEAYTLFVTVNLTAKSKFYAVEAMLRKIVPANMIVDLSINYNKYCTLAEFTHKQLSKYTHAQLRNEPLSKDFPINGNKQRALSVFAHTELGEHTYNQLRNEEI